MKKNLTIPLHKISKLHNEIVLLGTECQNNNKVNTLLFPNLATEWLSDFLQRHKLLVTNNKDLQSVNIGGKIIIKSEANLYRLFLTLVADIECECIRCLTVCPEKLNIMTEAFFVNESQSSFSLIHNKYTKGEEVELTEELFDEYEHNRKELILDEFILDSLEINYPEHYLCHEICKGLCHECGTNLNNDNCLHTM